MRRIAAAACAVVLALGVTGNAFAASSIGSTYTSRVESDDDDDSGSSSSSSESSQSTTTASTTGSSDSPGPGVTSTTTSTEATVNHSDGSQGSLGDGESIVVTEASADRYENTSVGTVVSEFNNNAQITVEQYVARVAETTGTVSQQVTNYGNDVALSGYTAVTDVLDLGIQTTTGSVVVSASTHTSYNTGVTYTVSQTVSEFTGYSREDVIFVQTDPVTGAVYYIEPDTIDPATGKWTATFPCLGPVIYMVRTSVAQNQGIHRENQVQSANRGNNQSLQNNQGQGYNEGGVIMAGQRQAFR